MHLNRFALRSLQVALASTTLGAAPQLAIAAGSVGDQGGGIVVLTRIDRQSAILPEPISVERRNVEVVIDTSPDDLLVSTMNGAGARVGDVVPNQMHTVTGDVGVRGARVATTPVPVTGLGAIAPRAGQAVASRIGSTLGTGTAIANRTPAVSVPGVSVNVPAVRVDVPGVSVQGPAAVGVNVPAVSVAVPVAVPVAVSVAGTATVDGIMAATDELLASERLAPTMALGGAAATVQFATSAPGATSPITGATSAIALDGGAAIAATLGGASVGRIAGTVTDAVRPISAGTSGIGAQIGSTLGTLGARLGAQR